MDERNGAIDERDDFADADLGGVPQQAVAAGGTGCDATKPFFARICRIFARSSTGISYCSAISFVLMSSARADPGRNCQMRQREKCIIGAFRHA